MTYNKYGNRKVTENGYTFDSMAEKRRYDELKLLQRAGHIFNLRFKKKDCTFHLVKTFKNGVNETVRGVKYIADFTYTDCDSGELVVEDVKGVQTKEFKLKKKWFESSFYPLTITLVSVQKPRKKRSKRRR